MRCARWTRATRRVVEEEGEDLGEQDRQVLLPEDGERGMIRVLIGRQHALRDPFAGGLLDLPRREHPQAVGGALEIHPQRRMGRGLAPPAAGLAHGENCGEDHLGAGANEVDQ